MRVKASCHCGLVTLAVPAAPDTVTECNCSICRRYGVLWAYYPLAQVQGALSEETTDTYLWDDRSIAFHRCRKCGCVTHWTPVIRSDDRMGVNARLFSPEVLSAARVRRLDGANTEEYLDD
jgi:hypothetical protein